MDQDLIDYITNVLAIADLRNLSPNQAVAFKIDTGNSTNVLVVVSYFEPDYRQYPFNVIWIPADTGSADYAKALRRSAKAPLNGYNNTWDELLAFAELTDEVQYYDMSDDNTFLLGELGIHGQVMPANQNRLGSVAVATAPVDPQSPLAVVTGDARMSDPRTPLAHAHPAQPFEKLVGSTTIVSDVTVSTSAAPVAGQCLKITGQIGGDPLHLTGEWLFLQASDITYTGPAFISLTILGPITVEENDTITLQAQANFSDLSTEIVAATWTVTSGTVATVDAAGVVTGLPVASDTVVTIQAEYTHPGSGTTQTQTVNVTVTDNAVPTTVSSIAINGPISVDEGNQATYTVTATYSDTSTALITPDTLTVPVNLGTIVAGTGIFTAEADVTNDQVGNIQADYDAGDGSGNHTATLSITVVDTTKTPASIEITGPTNIDEGTTGQFIATVTYTDTTTAQVVGTWTNDIGAAGSIVNTGVYTANSVGADTADVVNVSYTENSVTVTDTYNIQVDDVPVVLSSIAISGATTIQEGNSAVYTVTGTYSDTSTADLTGSASWAIIVGGSNGSFVGNTFTANSVTGNQNVTIEATVNIDGTHTDTHAIVVEDTPVYPLYGYAPANTSADSSFITTYLTNPITGGSPQIVAFNASNETDYFWIAFPQSQILHVSGDVQILNIDSTFPEDWDAANCVDFYDGVCTGTQAVTHNGETWLLYRNDFAQGSATTINYQFTWE